jgi:hypothetical protein
MSTTRGGGFYMEIERWVGKRIRLDFNTATGSPIASSEPAIIASATTNLTGLPYPQNREYLIGLISWPTEIAGSLLHVWDIIGRKPKGEKVQWQATVVRLDLKTRAIKKEHWPIAKIDFKPIN